MGNNQRVFYAQRLRVLLWFAGSLAFGLWFATAAHGLAFAPNTSFHGRAAILAYVPPEIRFGLFVAVAAFLCFAGVVLLRFVIDPKTVVIGDDGIEVFNVWGSRRGRWAEFSHVAERKLQGRTYTSLKFQGATGAEASVALNLGIMGVPLQEVLAEAQSRVARVHRGVPPPGATARPEPSRPLGPPKPPRRTFGRRAA